MRLFKKAAVEEEVLDKVLCDACGEEISLKNGDYLYFEKEWGYFSSMDGERHKADVCEECYKDWICSFKHPINE